MRRAIAAGACLACGACGDDGGGGAADARIDAPIVEGALVESALVLDDPEAPTGFDVIPDVTGDGRDDVLAVYFPRASGPELVILSLAGDRLARVASIESGDVPLTPRRALVHDVVGDARPELVVADPYEGVLRAFATPIAGDRDAADAIAVLDGPRNSFFATSFARGPLLAGGGEAVVIATPGEPEEACFSSEAPVLLARPWPATGTVAAAAAAHVGGGDPFDCLGVWMTGERDWTGDGTADLIVTTTSGGARLFAGPIADGVAFDGGVALAIGLGPYGGYGIAGGAIVDADGDGALDLALVDLETRSVRAWAAPIDPARSFELPLPGEAPVLVAGPRPADLDGDGDADLATIDRTFNPSAVTVLAMPGGAARWTSARATAIVRTGDLDGDGRAEVIAHDGGGAFRLLRVP